MLAKEGMDDPVWPTHSSARGWRRPRSTGGAAAARRGDAAIALHTRGRGAQYVDGRHGNRMDQARPWFL